MVIFGPEQRCGVRGSRVGDAVAEDVVRGLEVEGFLDLGVGGDEQVEEDDGGDEQGEDVV